MRFYELDYARMAFSCSELNYVATNDDFLVCRLNGILVNVLAKFMCNCSRLILFEWRAFCLRHIRRLNWLSGFGYLRSNAQLLIAYSGRNFGFLMATTTLLHSNTSDFSAQSVRERE